MAQIVGRREDCDAVRMCPFVALHLHLAPNDMTPSSFPGLMGADQEPQAIPPQEGRGHVGPEDVAALPGLTEDLLG